MLCIYMLLLNKHFFFYYYFRHSNFIHLSCLSHFETSYCIILGVIFLIEFWSFHASPAIPLEIVRNIKLNFLIKVIWMHSLLEFNLFGLKVLCEHVEFLCCLVWFVLRFPVTFLQCLDFVVQLLHLSCIIEGKLLRMGEWNWV